MPPATAMPSLEELQDEIKQRTDQIERVEADLKSLVGCENITFSTYIPQDKMDHEEYQATMLKHKIKIDSLQPSITASFKSLTTMQKPYKVNQFGGMGAMYADNDKLAHAQARESYRNFLKSTKPINAAEFIQSKNALETELISAYEALRTAQIAVADLK